MDGLGLTRGILLRTVARVGAALVLAAWLAVAMAGPGLAATDSGPASSSGNTTLIVAGIIGAVLAAVWLLKPSRGQRSRGEEADVDASHGDDPPG
jgi:uncharacterized membrane protein HdeD (DUF308 family)